VAYLCTRMIGRLTQACFHQKIPDASNAFPVMSRKIPSSLYREFGCKALNSRANWSLKMPLGGQIPKNSLLFSLLAGTLVRRLVRTRLPRQPASPVSVGCVRFEKKCATFPRVKEPPRDL
jgi:hypothetical protein